jgi:hypothetical protein
MAISPQVDRHAGPVDDLLARECKTDRFPVSEAAPSSGGNPVEDLLAREFKTDRFHIDDIRNAGGGQ